jgi:cell division protein FtsI (penicillin-binding protein 3)
MDAMSAYDAFQPVDPDIELAEKAMPIYPKSWGRLTNMTVGLWPWHRGNASPFGQRLRRYGQWRNIPSRHHVQNKGRRQDGPGKRVFTAATSARMRQLMRMIVVDGTGRKADALGYRVGGKDRFCRKAGRRWV